MLRLLSHSFRTAECEAMIGAFVSCSVCIIVSFDGCETSIMIPSRFISATALRPSGDRPFHFQPSRSPVFESASWLCPLWASERYRAPRS